MTLLGRKIVWNTKEIAIFLGMHPLTINRYAREGKIPAFRLGSKWRFHKRHIERWIKSKLLGRFKDYL